MMLIQESNLNSCHQLLDWILYPLIDWFGMLSPRWFDIDWSSTGILSTGGWVPHCPPNQCTTVSNTWDLSVSPSAHVLEPSFNLRRDYIQGNLAPATHNSPHLDRNVPELNSQLAGSNYYLQSIFRVRLAGVSTNPHDSSFRLATCVFNTSFVAVRRQAGNT